MVTVSPTEYVSCPICGPKIPFKIRYPAKLDEESLSFTARKTPTKKHFQIVQCQGCGLVYSNPRIPQEEIIKLYSQSEFIAEPQLQNMLNDYMKEIEKVLGKIPHGNFLEIGCSNGFLMKMIQDKYDFKNVLGVEPSALAIQAADPSIQERIYRSELKEGLFPKDFFDIVCFFQVFDHITDPNRFLKLVHDYLKKDGILLAIHHNIRALMPTLLGASASTYDISHMFLWDKSTMHKILEKNGFEVLTIHNTPNSYQIDHIIRMLPLPPKIKESLRTLFKKTRLSDRNIRACVENMVTVARK